MNHRGCESTDLDPVGNGILHKENSMIKRLLSIKDGDDMQDDFGH